jgi:hypothetical protein
LPHADDVLIVRKCEVRQRGEWPPAHLGQVVGGTQLAGDIGGGVHDEHHGLTGRGNDGQHGAKLDRKAGLLQRLAASGVLDTLTPLDEARGKAPLPRLASVSAAPSQQDLVLATDEDGHGEFRVKVGDRPADSTYGQAPFNLVSP